MSTLELIEEDLSSTKNAVFKTNDANDDVRSVFELVNLSVLTSALCLLGIVTNLINVAVFYRQGMRSTVNVSFMALSLTDLFNALLTQWISLCTYPLLLNSRNLEFLPKEVSYVTAGVPHGCLTRITAWITAYMAAERCLCIALPFKVKRLITPRRTVMAMIAIYIFTSIPMIPQYLFYNLDWTYYPKVNQTLFGVVVNMDYISLEGLTLLIYSIEMMVSFMIVLLLTSVLILQLKKMTQWRNESLLIGNQSKLFTLKDKMAVRTVVVIACVLIVTFTPSFVFCGACFIVPGFTIGGEYTNMYTIVVSFVCLFDATNASVNIVLHLTLNTGYRQTLLNMFSIKRKRA